MRQLDAVASGLLVGLAGHTPLVPGIEGLALVDVDDTIIEVHGYAKQGSGYGYSGGSGLERAAGHGEHIAGRPGGAGAAAA